MTTSPHRYTHPATATPPELEPGAGVIDATRSEGILAGYGLTIGDAVEVELLVGAGTAVGPRIVEGTIAGAHPAVLVVESAGGRVTNRIPWPAVANVRNRPDHPGL